MKLFIGVTVAAILAVGSVSVHAGSACCPSAAKAQAKAPSCTDSFAKLNLTDDQKAKLQALEVACKESKCSDEARAKFMTGAKAILNAEQLATWEADCKRMKDAGVCPVKADKKI